MEEASRELQNSNTNGNGAGNGKFKIGNKLAQWRKNVPSRRLEFENYLRIVGEHLKEGMSQEMLDEIKAGNLDVIKYLATRKLAGIMFPKQGKNGNSHQQNKLSLDAMEMMFSHSN